MTPRNSLTVILPLCDAVACQTELEQQRAALESGWAHIPGLLSACLALLPAEPSAERARPALLFECSFEIEFSVLMRSAFARLGPELSAVLAHCAEYPAAADAGVFAEYLGSRAQRSATFGGVRGSSDELELGRCWWRALDALARPRTTSTVRSSEQELEARRLAVGMQEPVPGVPLVHVAWLLPDALPRAKRALRELGRCAALAPDARFLIADARLVLVAYPTENAQRWSEQLSQVALGACTGIWRHTQDFPPLIAARRARRERRLQEFVLEHRVPVAAWFNARLSARREG